MGCRIVFDEIVRPQRLDGGKKPSLVFAVRQDDFARQPGSCCRGPSLHLGAKFCGAVVVAIEYDEDCFTGRLTARHFYSPRHAKFACELTAGEANRLLNLHLPSLRLFEQTS